MSNKEFQKKLNEQHSAHLLLTEFVKREADDIARALESIIPLHYEVTYDGLARSMGVVNQTFASIALQLIQHNSELDPEDPDNMVLPVGARTMNDTIDEMSKFINSVRYLFFVLNEKFNDDAAIRLTREVFMKYEPQM